MFRRIFATPLTHLPSFRSKTPAVKPSTPLLSRTTSSLQRLFPPLGRCLPDGRLVSSRRSSLAFLICQATILCSTCSLSILLTIRVSSSLLHPRFRGLLHRRRRRSSPPRLLFYEPSDDPRHLHQHLPGKGILNCGCRVREVSQHTRLCSSSLALTRLTLPFLFCVRLRECYCDSSLGKAGSTNVNAPAPVCGTPCPGNSYTNCGGEFGLDASRSLPSLI